MILTQNNHIKHIIDPLNNSDHQKQTDQSWGAPTGEAEWTDEKAGEAIAQVDASGGGAPEAGNWDASATYDPNFDTPANAALPAEEPLSTQPGDPSNATEQDQQAQAQAEDKSRGLDDYLAEQLEKRAKLSGNELQARKANEGAKGDAKWKDAKPLEKGEENQDYFAGSGGKAKRERTKKEKNVLDVEIKYTEPSTGRGGSERGGRGRGGEGGGRGRGGEGRGEFRGRGRGRGDGFRGRGEGGGYRGGRGGRGGGGGGGGQINANDENAFPSLGGGGGGGKQASPPPASSGGYNNNTATTTAAAQDDEW